MIGTGPSARYVSLLLFRATGLPAWNQAATRIHRVSADRGESIDGRVTRCHPS